MSRTHWRRDLERVFAWALCATFLMGSVQRALGQSAPQRIDKHEQDDALRENARTNGWFVYAPVGSGVSLLAYVGPSSAQLEIPAQINGAPVQRIGPRAFYKGGFQTVAIPDSVQAIGAFAFGECTNLTCITLPAKLEKIDDFSFLNCTRLERVIVSAEVESIGKMAFAGCERLAEINFPDRLHHIADGAFIQTKLTQINAPASLDDVGVGAFAQCAQLTNVVFGASGVTLQANAFGECTRLSTVTFLGTVRKIGVLAFTGCPALQRVRFKIPTFRIMDPTAVKDSPHVNFYQLSKEGDVKLERVTLFMKEDQRTCR